MLHAGSIAGEEVDDPVDPDEYNEAADGTWLPQVRQRLSRRYPAMHRGYGRGGYGALYAITPDWHPILDRCPGLEGVYCAVGFCAGGRCRPGGSGRCPQKLDGDLAGWIE